MQAAATTSGTVSIEEAEWGDSKLKVKGKVKPGRVAVTVVDAGSGATLGTTTANDEGKWKLEVKLGTAPCKVQARAGDQLSTVVTVKGTPKSCRAEPGDDDDDDDR